MKISGLLENYSGIKCKHRKTSPHTWGMMFEEVNRRNEAVKVGKLTDFQHTHNDYTIVFFHEAGSYRGPSSYCYKGSCHSAYKVICCNMIKIRSFTNKFQFG